MEMNAQKELLSENSMTFNTDQYKIDTENQKLSDQTILVHGIISQSRWRPFLYSYGRS